MRHGRKSMHGKHELYDRFNRMRKLLEDYRRVKSENAPLHLDVARYTRRRRNCGVVFQENASSAPSCKPFWLSRDLVASLGATIKDMFPK